MGKANKIEMKYRGGVLPEGLGDLLRNADETDLRILVAVQMLADRETGVASIADLPERLGLERSEVAASVKFWRGAGVLALASESKRETSSKEATPKQAAQTPAQPDAHRGGAILRSGGLTGYSTAELAELMEKRESSAQFVDAAQRIMGKMFRKYDTELLMGIVDQLGFEEAAVLQILSYAKQKGKTTLRYVEQMAIALYDEGITETHAVIERVNRMERAGEVVAKIRTMFGIGDRELTANEKKLFGAWTEKYAYDLDVIRMAYDITVDSIQKPVPKYTNSILEKWYAEGLRTAEDVRAYLETVKPSENGSTPKSYDVEDFFEAALQRSYENLE